MAVIIVVQTHTINLTALNVTYDVQVMFNVRSINKKLARYLRNQLDVQ